MNYCKRREAEKKQLAELEAIAAKELDEQNLLETQEHPTDEQFTETDEFCQIRDSDVLSEAPDKQIEEDDDTRPPK